ncbi:hypothetical protein PM082_024586 [Marasmius tenuissimus]|nr:hypothetical protein PM082_024586 [Marasmius tenuissimus]
MLKSLLYFLIIAQVCASFKIDAPSTVTVGVTATATWVRDKSDEAVKQINLVQDGLIKRPEKVLDEKQLSEQSGLVIFTAKNPG